MNLRSIATPVAAGAFLLVGTTGLCEVFELKGGLVEPIHEFSGILLVAGASLHVVANRAAMFGHLRTRLGKIVVLAAALAAVGVVASAFLMPEREHGEHGRPGHEAGERQHDHDD